ncbi:MAG: GxxExxY protein [Gemmatimonadaceae bacterium]
MPRIRSDGTRLLERNLTGEIIAAFYDCYSTLGFGFLESVYRRSVATELRSRGLRVSEEVPLEVVYRGVVVGHFRLDLVVEGRVVVEVKSTRALGPTDQRQLINYLRAANIDVGLLLHFGPAPEFHRLVSPQVLARRTE